MWLLINLENRFMSCWFRGSNPSLLWGSHSLRLTFYILEELLLLDDEVFLLGEVRLQLGDSLLRCLQLLTLNQQVLPQRLHLFPIRHLQHLGLLGGGDIVQRGTKSSSEQKPHERVKTGLDEGLWSIFIKKGFQHTLGCSMTSYSMCIWAYYLCISSICYFLSLFDRDIRN